MSLNCKLDYPITKIFYDKKKQQWMSGVTYFVFFESCSCFSLFSAPLPHAECCHSCDLQLLIEVQTTKLYPIIILHFKACWDYCWQSITSPLLVFHTVPPSPGFCPPCRFIKCTVSDSFLRQPSNPQLLLIYIFQVLTFEWDRRFLIKKLCLW